MVFESYYRTIEKKYKPKVGKGHYRVWTDVSLAVFPSCCGALILHDVNTFNEYFSGKIEDDWQFEEGGVPTEPRYGLSPKKHYDYVLKELLNPQEVKGIAFDSPFRTLNMYSIIHAMCAHEIEIAGTITEFVKHTKEHWIFPGRMIANRKPGHGNYLFHAMMYLHKDTKLMSLNETAKSTKGY